MYDVVTGLPRQELLLDRIGVAVRQSERTGQPPAVIYVAVTVTAGADGLIEEDHDPVIREVADRLVSAVRGDDTVARIDTSLFAVMFQAVSEESKLDTFARRVLRELSPPVDVGPRLYFLDAKIGGTLSRLDDERARGLCSRAEEALERARRSTESIVIDGA